MTASTKAMVRRPDGFRSSTFTILVSTIAISLLSLALPVTTLQIYDRVLPNQTASTLTVLAAGVIVVIFLDMAIRLARTYLIGFSGATYVHKLSSNAMRHLLNSDSSEIQSSDGRVDFMSLGAIRNLKDFHNGHALSVVIELIFLPVFFGLIAYIGGILVLVPLVILSLFLVLTLNNGLALKAALADRDHFDNYRYNFLVNSLNAIHTVKALAQEPFLARRYERFQGNSCTTNFGVSEAMTASFNLSALFSQIMTAATVGFGAYAAINETLTVGSLIAVVLLSGRIMQPIQRGLLLWIKYQDYLVSRDKVENIFSLQNVSDESVAEAPSRDGMLQVEGLKFSYPKSVAETLSGIDIALNKGSAISIAGGQGSGKTTLLKLIAGIHKPDEGQVLVDGVPTTKYPIEKLNAHVGYLATNGTIFRGTIGDNLTRFGDVPIAQAMYVAKLIGLDKEIAALPAGLQTSLDGSSADSIPPGLKQRIAIVRVLASKPRIILFDNADKALDVEGYELVYRLLGRLRSLTAMVIVSDDENLRSLATQHYELSDGRLHARRSASDNNQKFRNVKL